MPGSGRSDCRPALVETGDEALEIAPEGCLLRFPSNADAFGAGDKIVEQRCATDELVPRVRGSECGSRGKTIEPPGGDRVEGTLLLVEKRISLRNDAQIDAGEVEAQQVVEERLIAAILELLGHLSKITVVAGASRVDVEHREAALIFARGHDPGLVRGHDELEVVLKADRIDAFGLDLLNGRCDQTFETALRRLVARPDRFVGLEQQARRHVGVKLPRHVSRVVNEEIVLREKRADMLADDGLA